MDSKILELGYGIKWVDITKIEEENGYIGIHIETKKGNLKCAECGSRKVIKRGYSIRDFKDMPESENLNLFQDWIRWNKSQEASSSTF